MLRCHKESAPHLYEGVDVFHQSLGPAYDELVNAGDGMRPAKQGSVKSLFDGSVEAKVHIIRPAKSLYGYSATTLHVPLLN